MTTLLSDLLQDDDDVLLENHSGGITWHKVGTGLKFSNNALLKTASPGAFYRGVDDTGTRLLRVTGYIRPHNSVGISAIGGVSACHDDVDATGGYYFGIRSDDPVGAVHLFGWNNDGDDLFEEETADYDAELEDTDIKVALEITSTEVRGYINDELKITVADATLVGTLIGLFGGWEDASDGEIKGPFTVEDVAPEGAPEAEFTFLVNHRTKTVMFKDLSTDSDGTIASWSWDFGDGNTSTEQNPTHDYDVDGDYYVTLTVTDDQGNTDSIQIVVTILGCSGEGVDPTYTTQTD